MANMATGSLRVRNTRKVGFGLLLGLISLACLLGFSALPIFAQKAKLRADEGNPLPVTTGDPLTVKPIDMPDVECTVVQWNESPKPVLTLLCPPQEVFAPLRVLIKLSWLKPEDAQVKPSLIAMTPGTMTKLRTGKTAAMVLLKIQQEGKADPQPEWVTFTGVVDVALLPRTKTR